MTATNCSDAMSQRQNIVFFRIFLTSSIKVALLLLVIFADASLVQGFSASLNSNNNNSPWKSASWQFVLNIGREASSSLPEEWGQSGARLSFPIQLEVESDRLPDQQQDALLGGSGANRLTVVNSDSITYVSDRGEQTVPFQCTGGWKLRLGRKNGHASLLRFWLDLGGSDNKRNNIIAQKNDVTLQANERLYFAAHCWRQADWEIGRQKLQPLLEAYERAQEKLESQVSHETGDRRLDGNDALETLAAYKDMAGLTLDRDEKRRQLQLAQEFLPPPENLLLGNWPGSTELMAIQPMEIFVQRRKGIIPSEEYHLLGSWTAKPLNVVAEEDEEFWYYEDDEEEEKDVEEYEFYDEDEDDEEDDNDGEEEEEGDGEADEASESTNATITNGEPTSADLNPNETFDETALSSTDKQQ